MQVEDFLTIERKNGIAIIWIDHKQEPQNIISPAIIDLLAQVFSGLENDDEVKAGVLISKKDNFIAGADIKSFSIEQKGDFRPYQEKGHRALERLEEGGKPFVAAVHGACMGLGTELALACHARIASDDSSTRFALPEVQLGLLPGGGGTQRLPRRVGIQRALDMMLAGRNVYAYQAKKWGLVDALTNKNKLLQAAVMLAERLTQNPLRRKQKKGFVNRLLEDNPLGRSILFSQAEKRAQKKSRGNYPAIPAILDCVKTGYSKGIRAGYEKELQLFETLMLGEESKALRALFFSITKNKKKVADLSRGPVTHLGVIGAGYMGGGIAEVSISKGINVVLKDIEEEAIRSTKKQVWKSLEKKLKYKALSQIEAERIIGRLKGQVTYEHFENLDLIIEAVVERMDVKKRIIDDLQRHASKNTIIASNTSSLSITEMAGYARFPERVIGMHYFSPVPKMPLLEIVRTPHTSEEVIDTCFVLGVEQGKNCIVVKDSPGFYVNRILAPYMNEALVMITEGVEIDRIDTAFLNLGFPIGPIALFDQVGLDIAAHIVDNIGEIVQGRPGFEVKKEVVAMYEDGRLGKKNRQGFYAYDKKSGKRKEPDRSAYGYFDIEQKRPLTEKAIQQRGLLLMLNEAALCLDQKIIENPEDGDLGAVMGIGFLPFTGGPFRYMDQQGVENIVSSMERMVERFGPRFTPGNCLLERSRNRESFYQG